METGALLREGLARPRRRDPGLRLRGLHEHAGRAGGRVRGRHYYDPPNMTFPFGTTRSSSRSTAARGVEAAARRRRRRLRRPHQPDDRRGADHGRPHRGLRDRRHGADHFDEDGNCIGSNFMDYLIPTAWETPAFELGETVTPSPHHPIGAKGVGESATVGSPAAYVNAIVDALAHAGVRNFEMPVTSDKVWQALNEVGLAECPGRDEVLAEAARLAAAGEPFALATVVNVSGPRPRAGATAPSSPPTAARRLGRRRVSEPVVVREALRAIGGRRAAARPDRPGRGGSGRRMSSARRATAPPRASSRCSWSRMARAAARGLRRRTGGAELAELARTIGWRVDPQVDARRRRRRRDHGERDQEALADALAPGGYVALVASAKRAGVVQGHCARRPSRRRRWRACAAPRDSTSGRAREAEIAVAVLAELVAWRHARRRDAGAGARRSIPSAG